MLDLHAGVHRDEVEAPVLVQELERAGAAVADAHAGFGADLADLGPLFVGDAGRGRFLDHLLVAALHRTVALAQVDRVALAVGQHLDLDVARRSGAHIPYSPNTAYQNTIPPGRKPVYPGNLVLEERIRSYIRWNAMAMVVKANRHHPADGGDLGGHIASFASLATMIACGQNHFWHAEADDHGGDLVYFQGHSSPGMYGRAYLEGRLTEARLDHVRQEAGGKGRQT